MDIYEQLINKRVNEEDEKRRKKLIRMLFRHTLFVEKGKIMKEEIKTRVRPEKVYIQ